MISADEFLKPLVSRGYTFFTGVPCSFLKPFINYVIQSDNLVYVTASSEGEAIGIAAGAYLAGRKTAVMCQNSGLGNTINPLTSLNYPFKIPTLLIVTLRGEPGIKDEPQHELMGQITGEALIRIGVAFLAGSDDVAESNRGLGVVVIEDLVGAMAIRTLGGIEITEVVGLAMHGFKIGLC